MSYDSDSSGEGDQGFSSTKVLLGYTSRDPTEDSISHLGGKPVGGKTESRESSA